MAAPWERDWSSSKETASAPWERKWNTPEEVKKAPESRNPFAVANDTVIAIANAAAGGVKSAADFVSPGNSFSKAIDEFIKHGEESKSDIVKAANEKYAKDMENAKSLMEEAAITAKYIKDNPLQSAGVAVGSFAGPGLAIKGVTKASQLLNASEKVASRLGLGTGIVTNAAMSGGDAAGSAYEMVMQTPDEILMQNDLIRSQVESGRSLEDVKKEAATTAARRASVVPALIGGATGAFGMERVLAGLGGKAAKGAFGHAVKSGLSEALQEAVEEGATEYSGRAAAQEYDPRIDPMKGVAGAATMGAALGAIPGAGIGVLDARRQLAEQAAQQEAAAQQATQTAEQSAAAIVPQAEQVQAQAEQAAAPQPLPFGIVDPNQVQEVIDQAGPIAEAEKEIDQDAALAAKAEENKDEATIARYKEMLATGLTPDGRPLPAGYRKNIEKKLAKLEAKVEVPINAEQPSQPNIEGNQPSVTSVAPELDQTTGGIEAPVVGGMEPTGGTAEPIVRTEGDERAALEAQQVAAAQEEEKPSVTETPEAIKTEEKRQEAPAPKPTAPAVKKDYTATERVFKKEHMPFVTAKVDTRASNPKNMEEAADYAAAETAFDLFDSAYAKLKSDFSQQIKEENAANMAKYEANKKLGLPVNPPEEITLHDILKRMPEKERLATIRGAVNEETLSADRRKQIAARDTFIASLPEAQQKAIKKKRDSILQQEVKSISKLAKETTASDKRKSRQKSATPAVKKPPVKKVKPVTAKETEKELTEYKAELVKDTNKKTSGQVSEARIVKAIESGGAFAVTEAIRAGYVPEKTKRITSITQEFAGKLSRLMQAFDHEPEIKIGKVEGNRPGKYDPESETITIDPNAPRDVPLDVVVLHEVTHYAADRMIDNRDKLKGDAKVALEQLDKLHVYVKNKLGKQFDIGNLKEFVAQAFSNPEFQVAMAKLPPMAAAPKSNIVNEFAKRVMRLLGMKHLVSEDNVLGQTLTYTEQLIFGNRVGEATGVSYMGEPVQAEEPREVSTEEFIEKQRLPEAPKGFLKSVRSWGFNKKNFKRLATAFQNERYEMKDLQRDLTRSGLLVVGDENKFNNLYDATTLAAGNYRTIDNTELKPITDKVYSMMHELMNKTGDSLETTLKKLSAYGIALHEGEVRKVKFLRKIKLRDDVNTVEWDGKKISPATAKARIFEELTSKNFETVAKNYGMTPEKLAKEYRKLLEQIVSVDTNIHPDVSADRRSPDHIDYNVVGELTPADTKRHLDYFAKDKNKDLMDKILKEMGDLSKKTIELNKEANYWSPQVSNLTNFYGYKNYVPYKGKLVNEKDKNLFLGEYLGKEFQQAEYTQEGRVSLPDNPILQMFAEAHLSAARAGRKDVMKAVYHMVQPNNLYKEGQGLINAQVKKIIPFEDRYNFEANLDLQKLSRRENMFFYYMDNGDIAVIEMKDNTLRDAIRKTYRQSNPLFDKLNSINSFFGQMHTRYNVAFAPKNFVRDALTNAYNISAGYSVKAAGRYMGAIAENVTRVGLLHAGKVASAYSKGGADPAKNPRMKALIESDKSGFTAMLAEYLQHGGDIAYVSSLSTKGQLKDFTKELGRPGKLYVANDVAQNFFDSWTAAFEFTSRASAYQIMKAEEVGRLMEKGLTRAQAEKDAIKPAVAAVKNLANFEEAGRFGKVAGAWFMFFRPAATGAVRAIESLAPAISSLYGGEKAAAERAWEQASKGIKDKGDKAKEEYIKNFSKDAQRGKAIAAIALGVGSAIYLMSYMTGGDDEMGRNRVGTDDMARWQRDARFFVGDGQHDIVNLPWGYGIGALAALGAQVTALGMSDTSFMEMMANSVPIMMDSFLPIPVSKGSIVEHPANYVMDSIAPSFIRPMFEFTMNQNSLGQEIYNKRQGPNGAIYTGGDSVPQIYKEASEFLYEASGFNFRMSPNVAYFFVNSYVDAIGKAGETGYNLWLDLSGQKDFDLKTDTAVLNGMIGVKSNYDARKWAAIEKDMEDRKVRLKEITDTNDPELYVKYMEANPLDEMLVEMYNGDAGGDLKELREQAQEIRRDRMLDLRTKKELLEVVKLQENLIKMQLVDLYKSFEVNP